MVLSVTHGTEVGRHVEPKLQAAGSGAVLQRVLRQASRAAEGSWRQPGQAVFKRVMVAMVSHSFLSSEKVWLGWLCGISKVRIRQCHPLVILLET